jgi:hypothetical protein
MATDSRRLIISAIEIVVAGLVTASRGLPDLRTYSSRNAAKPGLRAPSTSFSSLCQDVDARHKAGHDEEKPGEKHR